MVTVASPDSHSGSGEAGAVIATSVTLFLRRDYHAIATAE